MILKLQDCYNLLSFENKWLTPLKTAELSPISTGRLTLENSHLTFKTQHTKLYALRLTL